MHITAATDAIHSLSKNRDDLPNKMKFWKVADSVGDEEDRGVIQRIEVHFAGIAGFCTLAPCL